MTMRIQGQNAEFSEFHFQKKKRGLYSLTCRIRIQGREAGCTDSLQKNLLLAYLEGRHLFRFFKKSIRQSDYDNILHRRYHI